MEISPILQAQLLCYSAVFGFFSAVAWDIIGSITDELGKKVKGVFILRFFCDFVLICAFGAGLLVLCYYFNKGGFRAFAVLGFLVAFFVTRAVLRRHVRRLVVSLLRVIFAIIRVILTPFVKLFKYLVNILRKFIYYIRKVLEKITILVYNILIKHSVLKKARKGFLTVSIKRRG